MPDSKDGDAAQNPSAPNQPQPAAPGAATAEADKPAVVGGATGPQGAQNLESNIDRAVGRSLRWPETIMAAFTVVIAIATAANVIVAAKQWGEMHSGGIDTHNLAVATGKLVTAEQSAATATGNLLQASKDQAAAAKSEATAMDRLRQAGEAQARSMSALADAGRSQARAVGGQLAAIQAQGAATRDLGMTTGREVDALVEANRPWTGVAIAIPAGRPTAGQDFVINIQLQNTGRGPSLNTRATFDVFLISSGDAIPAIAACQNCSEATILPNGGTTYAPRLDGKSLTPDVVAAIEAGTTFVAISGRIDYTDVLGHPHWDQFCASYSPKMAGVSNCIGGNSAN